MTRKFITYKARAPNLRDSLRRIEATLGVEPFSPKASKRRFVIAANDHMKRRTSLAAFLRYSGSLPSEE
jgi:hypothetical protein